MDRNSWILLGVVLLVVGLAALLLDGITYVTQEEVLELGPIEVTAERERRLAVPPWASLLLIVLGAVSFALGAARGSEA